MITSFKNILARIDPAWRTALGVFILARLFYFLWSLAILVIYPLAVQNTILFGKPVLTAFDLTANRGYVYNRQVVDKVLTFRAAGKGVMDIQTGSLWDLVTGKAIAGIYAGQSFLPVDQSVEGVFPYQGESADNTPILAVWQRFDTNWYLKIAQSGYSETDGSTAFFPLYPLSIKFFGFILGNNLLAALLVSNAALVGALVLLYKLAAEYLEVRVVQRSLVYLMVFPTSFFFFAAYTEAPFLFLVLASLLAAKRKQWIWAALFGSLAALTRLQGVLIFVPLTYIWWRQTGKRAWMQAIILGLIPLSTLSFLFYTRLSLIGMYQNAWNQTLVWPWMNIWAALGRLMSGVGTLIDMLNLAVTVLFGILCVVAWYRLPREWFLYSAAMFLVPLFRMNSMQPLVSMSRYVLVLFPLFCLLGKWGQKPWVNRLIVYAGFLAALYFSAQFFSWGWVA
jgi:Gpi18-like mannosyltransferase